MQPSRVSCLTPAHPGRRTSVRGFTVIELMVTVAVLAVLAALAAPSFNSIIERWRVRQAAEELQSTVYMARSEAIKRGGGIAIDAPGGWDQGWKITHTQAGATTDLQVSPAPTSLSITQSNGSTTLFVDRWGMLSETVGGASTTMDVLLHPAGKSTTDSSAIRLCIAGGGRIVQTKQGAACPP
ncbi:GspH/FimT family pseudopilin [[Acidovorax] ebreus]|nr:GspH/FimT family pseudopilin [[Acidovorax] ebreus]